MMSQCLMWGRNEGGNEERKKVRNEERNEFCFGLISCKK